MIRKAELSNYGKLEVVEHLVKDSENVISIQSAPLMLEDRTWEILKGLLETKATQLEGLKRSGVAA